MRKTVIFDSAAALQARQLSALMAVPAVSGWPISLASSAVAGSSGMISYRLPQAQVTIIDFVLTQLPQRKFALKFAWRLQTRQ